MLELDIIYETENEIAKYRINARCLRNQLKVIKLLNTLYSTFFMNAGFLDVVKYNYVLHIIPIFVFLGGSDQIYRYFASVKQLLFYLSDTDSCVSSFGIN